MKMKISFKVKVTAPELVEAINANTRALEQLALVLAPSRPSKPKRPSPLFVSQRFVQNGVHEMKIIGFVFHLLEETEANSQDVAKRVVTVTIPDDVPLADDWGVPRVQQRDALSKQAADTQPPPFEAPEDTNVLVSVVAVDLDGHVREPQEFELVAADLVAPARPGRPDASFVSQRDVADIEPPVEE